jgi:hypothetical protein
LTGPSRRALPETGGEAGSETGVDRGVDVPGACLGSRSAGIVLVLAAALAVVAGWWLLAEPVASPVLWAFDRVDNHGVQEADLPGIAGLLLAGWLWCRGLGAWRRARPAVTGPE